MNPLSPLGYGTISLAPQPFAWSVLQLLTPEPDANGMVVTRQSVLHQIYLLERATNASGPFSLLQGTIPVQAGTTNYSDTNAGSVSPLCYRVGVGN